MLYVATVQPATIQLDAIKCDFIQEGVECMVVNKLTRLEVFKIDGATESLQSILTIPLHATISSLNSIKLPTSKTSSLVVLTTSHQLFTLEYAPNELPHRVRTGSSVSIREKFGNPSDIETILVDPNKKCILVHCYKGLIRAIPLTTKISKGRRASHSTNTTSANSEGTTIDLSRSFNIRLDPLNIRSVVLLSSFSSSTTTNVVGPEEAEEGLELMTIHSDAHGQQILSSFKIDLEERELKLGSIPETILDDPGSEIIIPFENEGVLVAGEESVEWFAIGGLRSKGKGKERRGSEVSTGNATGGRGKGKKIRCRLPVGNVRAWTRIATTDQFLLGDVYGKLMRLDLGRDSSGSIQSISMVDLGDTSSPTALVSLSPTLLYLASRFGESQLIRLQHTKSDSNAMMLDTNPSSSAGTQEGPISLIASLTSLGPITDSVLVQAQKDGRNGAGYLVTCSGAYKGGSLRVVRRGANFVELASLEIEKVQKMWALKGERENEIILFLSFFDSTRILQFSSEGEIEELEFEGLDTPTLLACRLGPSFVQVTSTQISMSDSVSEMQTYWTAPEDSKITLADSNEENRIVLALKGGGVQLLQVSNGSVAELAQRTFTEDVASIVLSKLGQRSIVVVAFWRTNEIQILDSTDLSTFSSATISAPFLVRSLSLVTFEGSNESRLFAGLGDGHLFTCLLNPNDGTALDGTEKKVALGTKPVLLKKVTQDGKENLMASSDRVTMISRANERLVYSGVNLKDVSSMVPFESSAFPNSIALSSSQGLQIGRIERLQHVGIQSIALEDEEPRKIAYDQQKKLFGVACLRRDVDRSTGVQTSVSSFRVFAEENIENLATITLRRGEEALSVSVLSNEDSEFPKSCFLVGTAIIDSAETEPSKGRVLLVEENNGSYEIVSETEVAGAVYSTARVDPEHFAAAINSTVTVFKVDEGWQSIHIAAVWASGYINFALKSLSDNHVLVGDALRSLTLLHFKNEVKPSLIEVARDHSPHYITALESVNEGTFIASESELNLFTLVKDETRNARTRIAEVELSAEGRFHLGEMATSFQPGSLAQQFEDNSSSITQPRLIFTTSAGSIGAIIELGASVSKSLSELERNMRKVLATVGNLSQEEHRSFKSESYTAQSAGFIDGDFIEAFLELSNEQIEKVLAGGNEYEKLTMSKGEVAAMVEEIARLH